MTAPRATIIVRSYNQERTVAEAVRSALAQTYEPLEVILSDDASRDRTWEIMQDLAAAYRGPHAVRLNRNPRNLGIAAHVSLTLGMATGEVMLSCAGDDFALPEKAARLVARWREGAGRVFCVHSKVMQIDAEGRELGLRAPAEAVQHAPDALTVARLRTNCIGATALWDRRLISRFGPLPDCCLIEDGPLFFRAALSGEIAYLDEALVRYRIGGVSTPQIGAPFWEDIRGHRMRARRWMVGNARSFLRDLAVADPPDRAEIEAVIRSFLEREAFEADLTGLAYAGRIAALPGTLWSVLRGHPARRLRTHLKHLLGPPWIALTGRGRP